ncbi:TRAP transporter small permease (plasmid) [Salipiger sp. H15]|uniref:TRAP transporter small permease protein n=1 Tax=Alloyangia sp. H15 TaxID=3029062 RepID=A0AAU8ARE9_9RHOB
MSRTQDDTGAAGTAPLTERALTPLVRLGAALSTALILATLVLTTFSALMRYAFDRPPVWVDALNGFLLVAIVAFGVAEAYRRNDHISIDLVTQALRGRARTVAAVFSDLCVLAFCAVLGISTWESIGFARMFGAYTSGAIEIESWIPQVPLLCGAVLLGAFAVARLLGHLFGKGRT